MCKSQECSHKMCRECIKDYVSHCVTGSKNMPYNFLKPIKCPNHPNCKEIVTYETWSTYATKEIIGSYHKKCRDWLSIRCTSCHTPHTLFCEKSYKPQFQQVLNELLSPQNSKRNIILPASCPKDLFQAFLRSEISAQDFIHKVFGTHDVTKPDTTTIKNLRQRIKDHETIASQIKSIEKRFRFQSQFYYTFRSCITTCTCKRRMCYYCKSNSHPGISCAENQARSPHVGQVNACPRCGIAIVKHDGCRSVKCVCGHSFNWRNDYNFLNNEGRRQPAATGTRVSGWVRSENGWTRIVRPPPPIVQREERWFERGMPLETFQNVRNRLATLYGRVLERNGVNPRSETVSTQPRSITRSFPRPRPGHPPAPPRSIQGQQPPSPMGSSRVNAQQRQSYVPGLTQPTMQAFPRPPPPPAPPMATQRQHPSPPAPPPATSMDRRSPSTAERRLAVNIALRQLPNFTLPVTPREVRPSTILGIDTNSVGSAYDIYDDSGETTRRCLHDFSITEFAALNS